MLDFALVLRWVVTRLETGDTEQHLDFTENGRTDPTLTRDGPDLRIAATYTADTAVVPLRAFLDAAKAFAERTIAELKSDYPALAQNAAVDEAMRRAAAGAAPET